MEIFPIKTALLKAISERIIPGLPDNLRILLVSQIDHNDEASVLAGEDEGTQHDPELTVTERVVKSDRRREKALLEQQSFYLSILVDFLSLLSLAYLALLKAFESTSITAIAEALFFIRLSRAKDEAEEARKIAQRRSGTRGSEARKQLLKAEAIVSEYEERLVTLNSKRTHFSSSYGLCRPLCKTFEIKLGSRRNDNII